MGYNVEYRCHIFLGISEFKKKKNQVKLAVIFIEFVYNRTLFVFFVLFKIFKHSKHWIVKCVVIQVIRDMRRVKCFFFFFMHMQIQIEIVLPFLILHTFSNCKYTFFAYSLKNDFFFTYFVHSIHLSFFLKSTLGHIAFSSL